MGLIGRSQFKINSRHCGGIPANGRFVGPSWRRRRKATLSHWWHLGGRSQSTRIEVARSLTPEVPHSWFLSHATMHWALALGRFFSLDRIWSIGRLCHTGQMTQALLIRTYDYALAKSKYTTSVVFLSSIQPGQFKSTLVFTKCLKLPFLSVDFVLWTFIISFMAHHICLCYPCCHLPRST